MNAVLVRIAKTKTFSNAVLATLETDVNTWLAAGEEKMLLDLQYRVSDTPEYSVLIVYTEA